MFLLLSKSLLILKFLHYVIPKKSKKGFIFFGILQNLKLHSKFFVILIIFVFMVNNIGTLFCFILFVIIESYLVLMSRIYFEFKYRY